MTKKPSSGLYEPPATLSREAASLWRRLVETHEIDDPSGRMLLRSALESWDRAEQARASIARDGMVVRDRFNQPKAHPLLAVERDARSSMLHALKALGLDLLPSLPVGRPPNTPR